MQLPGAYRRRLFWLTATCHTRVYNFARTALSPSLPRHAGLAAPWTSKARHAMGPMHLLLLPYTYFLAEMLSSLPHLHSCLCPNIVSSDRPPDHSLLGDGTCPKHFVLTLFYFSSQHIPSLPQTLQTHVFAFCTVVVTTTRSTGIVYVK